MKCADLIIAAWREESCPGHVASVLDPKICGRCGVHIDSFRPPDDYEGDFPKKPDSECFSRS